MFQTVENLLSPALSSFLRQEERELTISCNRTHGAIDGAIALWNRFAVDGMSAAADGEITAEGVEYADFG